MSTSLTGWKRDLPGSPLFDLRRLQRRGPTMNSVSRQSTQLPIPFAIGRERADKARNESRNLIRRLRISDLDGPKADAWTASDAILPDLTDTRVDNQDGGASPGIRAKFGTRPYHSARP